MSELQHHINCKKGDVGRYVFLPGDPGRVPLISSFFDEAEKVTQKREYLVHTGYVDGIKVSAVSTGIGGPSTAIAAEELANIGADTVIRLGTAGQFQSYTGKGDLVIATAAIRHEGTSKHYFPVDYPAVADFEVVNAMLKAADRLPYTYHKGIVHSKDSFYGEVEPEKMPVADDLKKRWEAWTEGNALASEMEAATLFVVAKYRKIRAGGIMNLLGDEEGMENMIKLGIESVKELAKVDRREDDE
ncbi:MAG: nucleoside phosphorylase [Halanaerobiaceae bacterium]